VIFQQALIGTSGSNVKLHNLRAILLTLLRQQNISRVRLAELTGLSTTTITNLIAELMEQGVVEEVGTEHPKRRSVGRPRMALQLAPEARYAVGIHIGVGSLRVSLTDLLAHPIAKDAMAHELDRSPREVLDAAMDLAERTVAQADVPPESIVGVGVGASGLVDLAEGVNVLAPNLGWRDVPIRQWCEERLPYPVCVNNNVRAMALAEAMFGPEPHGHGLAFVYARIGVGAGFVVGNQLYSGSGAGAGEIGHMTIITESERQTQCRCGNYGCLETLFSEPVIVRAAKALAETAPDGILAQSLASDDGSVLDRVFAAAEQGDAATRAMLAERAGYMGIALANLINILNPDRIVLGGMFVQGRPWLLPAVEATMRRRAFANLGERVQLETTSFGRDVGAIGAAALALNQFFYQQNETYESV
jgi:predicted NBD/HSP70 family sugar kinase